MGFLILGIVAILAGGLFIITGARQDWREATAAGGVISSVGLFVTIISLVVMFNS